MSRSQAAFIQATLAGREMDSKDMEFHRKYLKEIEQLRAEIRQLEGK